MDKGNRKNRSQKTPPFGRRHGFSAAFFLPGGEKEKKEEKADERFNWKKLEKCGILCSEAMR